MSRKLTRGVVYCLHVITWEGFCDKSLLYAVAVILSCMLWKECTISRS